MQLRRKKTLMDRAHDVAEQVAETVIPALGTALEQTKEKAVPALTDARDRALPLIAEGRAAAAEKAALATERASASAALAAERAQLGAALAANQAAVGRTLAAAKIAELRREQVVEPEPEPGGGGKLKKLLLLSGLVALGALLFSKLRGKKDDNWQSSYTPAPAPEASSGSSTAAGAGATVDEVLVPAPAVGADPLNDPLTDPLTDPAAETDDVGGGAPGEAISDTVEEPRQPSTPDQPMTVVDIDEQRDR
jgi:hypothetical protein